MNHLTLDLDQHLNDLFAPRKAEKEYCGLCFDEIEPNKTHSVEHDGKRVEVCIWCMNNHNDDNN